MTVRFDDDATPFQAALARVAVTDDTRAGLEFGGAKAITALAASDDPKDVWGQLFGFGVPLGDLAAVVDAATGAGRGRPSRPDRSASRLSRLLPALAGATVLLIVLPSIVSCDLP